LRRNPHIDVFHLLDKTELSSPPRRWAWYRRVAAHGYDLLVDFQQLPRCRILTRLSRAPVRLSFPAPWYRPLLYTHQVTPLPGYAAAAKVSLLSPFGVVWRGEPPAIRLDGAERKAARDLLASLGLRDGQRLITVDSTHRRDSKRWPAARYAGLIDLLAGALPDVRFLLLRGPGEEEEACALQRAVSRPERVLLPAGPPNLRLSAACVERAALHVGNCSAPRHIAVAVGTPSLVIPGASGPEWRYPDPRHRELRPPLPCRPCRRTSCPSPACLELVTPQAVAGVALEMLGETPADR
jgi:ADP-heptose:LPS heptosyltransferase